MLATDLRIVADTARIMTQFLRIGIHPGGGHFWLLGRLGGREAAAGMTLFGDEIDGRRAYPSLKAYAQEHGAPDIVDVFRKPSEAPAVAREAIEVGAKAIWFQYGVVNQEAIELADRAGLDHLRGCAHRSSSIQARIKNPQCDSHASRTRRAG